MASLADDIPDFERLLRNVVRQAMEAEHGIDWLAGLSNTQAASVRAAGDRARRNRPDEKLRDDWEAVGIEDVRAVLRSSFPQALSTVWPDRAAADVDLARISAYRGKNLHAVGPPSSEMSDVEVGAMMHRLRVGLEAVRRRLLNEVGDWWPYIAAVHSNIPEFCWERSAGGAKQGPGLLDAVLVEGDTVELTLVGEHPRAGRDRLRYRFLGTDVGLGVAREWSTTNTVRLTVPLIRELTVTGFVVDVDHTDGDAQQWEGVAFMMHVRPADAAGHA